jgi:glycosyltransferase involved in cell wall biosynthesis
MRILHVTPRYYPDIGGVEEHVRNIVELLSKTHDVHVFATDPSGKLPKQEVTKGVEITRFGSWAPNEAYFLSLSLRKRLKEVSGDFDIVHTHCYSAFPSLFAAQAKAENKLVFTPHYHGVGHTFFRSLLHKPYKFFGRQIFEKADRVICVSQVESDLVQTHFQGVKEKLSLIPNGVNYEEFRNLERSKGDSKTILFVGRLEKYKGVQHLLRVLPRFDKDVRLEIIGTGPYKPTLLELAKKLSITDRVEFLHDLSRQNLLQKYADADVFVLLSEHEAYGITVAEALCAGTPCVVATTSALVEWIDDVNCFGIDIPINLEKLKALIDRAMNRRATAGTVLDWTTIAGNVLNLYSALLGSVDSEH